MTKDLIINASKKVTEIALLEDKNLTELHQETGGNNYQVGDLYLGKIKKIMPGLNAAFVDVGHKKDAFLHYTDLGPNIRSLNKYVWESHEGKKPNPSLDNFAYEPEIIKTGKINQALIKKKPILVQILKEPISTKGPRLSCEINLAGRYLVISPFTKHISISKKINSSDERKRLQKLIESIKPKNFGVIVRTIAQGKRVSELHHDMQQLLEKWNKVQLELSSSMPPEKVFSEVSKTSSLLRDLLNNSFTKIYVNDKFYANDLKAYVSKLEPGKEKIVNYVNSKRTIFDQFGVTKQIKSSFGKTVTMASGAYLVIEHTEAMHVIDVNSGHKVGERTDQESQALVVNLESAAEIARQLRLRDIGGIIIIDFIDMKQPENKKTLLKRVKECMLHDRAKHTILPLSRFGLMQITRQRDKPEIKIKTQEVCATCNGTGNVKPSILLLDDIEDNISYLFNEMNMTGLKLYVHPYIEGFIKRGLFNKQWQWYRKYKKWLKVHANNDYALTEYHFFDKLDEKIQLKS